MSKEATAGSFKKQDPRINRKGRPRSFDALRELAQSIAHEKITEVNGHGATVAEMILRKWALSTNPILQRAFIEVAFGKVPDNIDITSAGQAIKAYIGISPDDWKKDEADES